jgi:hypothetical protein
MRWSYLIYDKKTIEKGIRFWEQTWKMAMTLSDFEKNHSDIFHF